MLLDNSERWLSSVDTLAENDYVIIDDAISEDLYIKIRSFFIDKLNNDTFEKAGIGSVVNHLIKTSERGDFVYWLESKRDQELSQYFKLIDQMVASLNQLCFLSISGYEFHLAHYPKDSFYKKHLDQFKERNNRLISVIIYLNQNWEPDDGGELKIYDKLGKEVIVSPIAKRCVMFKSDSIEHEVLKTNVSRYSLTGWLLYQPASLGYLLG